MDKNSEKISKEEAIEQGNKLIRLVQIIYKPLNNSQEMAEK